MRLVQPASAESIATTPAAALVSSIATSVVLKPSLHLVAAAVAVVHALAAYRPVAVEVVMEHPVATPSRLAIVAAASLTTMPLRRLTDDGPVMATVSPHSNLLPHRTMSLSRGVL